MHETQFKDFLAVLGLSQTPPEKVFGILRTLPMIKIQSASEKVFVQYTDTLRWPFQPVIDGEGGIIPMAPIKKWKSGTWHPIPILTGFNTNEGAVFVDPTVSTDEQFTAFFSLLLPKLSTSDITTLQQTYPDPLTNPTSPFKELRSRDFIGPQYTRLEQAYGHFAYVSPVRQTVDYASKKTPVWLYRFEVNSRHEGGADHGDHDNFVTYDQEIREVSPNVREISGKMHAYWTSFVTTGDPNAEGGRCNSLFSLLFWIFGWGGYVARLSFLPIPVILRKISLINLAPQGKKELHGPPTQQVSTAKNTAVPSSSAPETTRLLAVAKKARLSKSKKMCGPERNASTGMKGRSCLNLKNLYNMFVWIGERGNKQNLEGYGWHVCRTDLNPK
jgi:hypothetical protein